MRNLKIMSAFVLTTLPVLLMNWGGVAAQSTSSSQCQIQPDICDTADFNQLKTGQYASPLSTPSGINFSHIDGKKFSVTSHAGIGNSLSFACDGAVVELPDPPYDKVSFTYEEHSSAGNDVAFQAIDANGNVVDQAIPINFNGPVESVALASKNDIVEVRMRHVGYNFDEDACIPDVCAEPHVGEVRACKT